MCAAPNHFGFLALIILLADAGDFWKVILLKLALYFVCLLLLEEALQGRLYC